MSFGWQAARRFWPYGLRRIRRRETRADQPDGRVYFAGAYMTKMSSWMQGAFESAREVATAIHTRAVARS